MSCIARIGAVASAGLAGVHGMSDIKIREHAIEIALDGSGNGASKEDLDAWLEKGMGGYSTEELREAFSKVSDKTHWKNDVDAVVPASMKAILEFAIPFHTGGGQVTFEDLEDGTLRVRAPGYWTNGMDG